MRAPYDAERPNGKQNNNKISEMFCFPSVAVYVHACTTTYGRVVSSAPYKILNFYTQLSLCFNAADKMNYARSVFRVPRACGGGERTVQKRSIVNRVHWLSDENGEG